MSGWSAIDRAGSGYRLLTVRPARRGWANRWWQMRRLAYAIAEVAVGLVMLLGLPAFLWLAYTR